MCTPQYCYIQVLLADQDILEGFPLTGGPPRLFGLGLLGRLFWLAITSASPFSQGELGASYGLGENKERKPVHRFGIPRMRARRQTEEARPRREGKKKDRLGEGKLGGGGAENQNAIIGAGAGVSRPSSPRFLQPSAVDRIGFLCLSELTDRRGICVLSSIHLHNYLHNTLVHTCHSCIPLGGHRFLGLDSRSLGSLYPAPVRPSSALLPGFLSSSISIFCTRVGGRKWESGRKRSEKAREGENAHRLQPKTPPAPSPSPVCRSLLRLSPSTVIPCVRACMYVCVYVCQYVLVFLRALRVSMYVPRWRERKREKRKGYRHSRT